MDQSLIYNSNAGAEAALSAAGLFTLFEAVLKGNGSVEYQMLGCAVLIGAEITQTHKLIAGGWLCLGNKRFSLTAIEDNQALRIDVIQEVLSAHVRLGVSKQVIIEPYLSIQAVVSVNPMDSAPDLPAVGSISASCSRVILCVDLSDLAAFVLFAACAFHDVCGLETNLVSGIKPVVALYLFLNEVISLNEALPCEGDGSHAVLRTVGIVLYFKGLGLTLRIVCDDEPYRSDNRHYTLSVEVKILSQAVLKEAIVNHAVGLGNAYALTEIADSCGSIAPSSQPAEGGHTGIIPAGYEVILHQLTELSLAHNSVVDAQTCKLDLSRYAGNRGVVYYPVIERSVILKLQGAQGMGDALDSVLDHLSCGDGSGLCGR